MAIVIDASIVGAWVYLDESDGIADAAVEVTVDASTLTELYDQAGLLLWVDDEHWVKAGLEVSDGVLHLGAVVTNGMSDWSMAPVPDWSGQRVTIRASRSGELGDDITLRARAASSGWRTVRVAPFPAAAASAGPMVCAPTRAGLEVRFTGWVLAPADAEHAIKTETVRAPARQIGLEELVGIILVLVPFRLLGTDA